MEKFKFSNRGNALVGQEMFKVLDKAKALENKGKKELEIIEVQSGSYLGEDDIVRFEDLYGRVDN